MVSEQEVSIPNQLQVVDIITFTSTTGPSSPISIDRPTSQQGEISPTPEINPISAIYESPKVNEEKPSCDSKKPKLSQTVLEITNENEEEESEEGASSFSNSMQEDSFTDSDINTKEKRQMKWAWSKIIYVTLAFMSVIVITYAIIACVMVNDVVTVTEKSNSKSEKSNSNDSWIPPFKVTLLTPNKKPAKLPAPKKGFQLSPFWNFERNPFMCGPDYPDALDDDSQAWCDYLFRDVNITPTQGLDYFNKGMKIPVLNTDHREIQEYRSHYIILRDLKVYKTKPYLWWFDKLEARECTNNLIEDVSFVHKFQHWKDWNEEIKNELKQLLEKHFQSATPYALIIKPGHTHRSTGIIAVISKNDEIFQDPYMHIFIYDENAFEKIVKVIDSDYYMNVNDFDKDKNHTAVPLPQIIDSPSIIIEKKIPNGMEFEIKCVFIFGVFKQCFTYEMSGKYQAKFNRDFDCVIDGQQPLENNQTKCENLLELMDWYKIIPQLEQLAYKMAFDWLRIDIFYIDHNQFYINEYETRSGSFHTYNKYLFDALKEAWKTPTFYDKKQKMNQLTCSTKMQKALNQYINNSSLK